ncbi:S8 family serine peptidase [Brevibacillus fluminis]|uniref:S8 family serine peptidase n=1 Tax=Brevibacillus fluminis TaxID=511487 RepID=UPI003F89AA5F
MKTRWHAALSGPVAIALLFAAMPTFASGTTLDDRTGTELSLRNKNTELAQPHVMRTAAVQSRLVIIQMAGPVQAEWKEELAQDGVLLGDYVPDFSFVAKLSENTDPSKLEQYSFVKRIVPYRQSYKISQELLDAINRDGSATVAIHGLQTEMGRKIVTETITQRDLAGYLASDDVVAIMPASKRVALNNVAGGIIHADKLADTGYTGANQIVGVIDTGLDSGKKATLHPDLQGQVKELIAVSRKGDASDPNGHGTHVAGSIVGTGAASDGKVKGMAPDARLIFHSVLDEGDSLAIDDDNLTAMLTEAYDGGARIHSDSWGEAYGSGEYDSDAQEMDCFVWEHPDMAILVAAGNDGSDEGTISSPATAKNVIAVGASESVRPALKDRSADNPDDIAYFSSRGPTIDGRIKPDVVAPGSMILSLRSQLAAEGEASADQGIDPNFYTYLSGTSMATPILAGGVAQIRQFLQENGTSDPSAALIKAMVINGADDLNQDTMAQGFGRANLLSAIAASCIDEQTDGLQTGNQRTYTVQVTDPDQPLIATLAWTDAPGSVTALDQLVNNLDLTIETPGGEIYRGNDREAPYDDEADETNNVERVIIPHPEKGTYTITVNGVNIPIGPQPFALVANATIGESQPGSDFKKERHTGTVRTGSLETKVREYAIKTGAAGTISLALNWESEANLHLYLLDSKGKTVAKATNRKGRPKTISYTGKKAAAYTVQVRAVSGEADYTIEMKYPKKQSKK